LIFHIFSEEAGHNKFIVIVGISKDQFLMGYVFINSIINTKISNTPELQKLHLRIRAADYPFLDYDSYIGCNGLFEISYQTIEDIVSDKANDYKGVLSEQDLVAMQALIKDAPGITNKLKKKYGYK